MYFKRILLTLAAIPAGVLCGFLLAIPIVGAPHAFPGLLMRAPEHVRNTVGLAVVIGTPAVLVCLIWFGVIWRAISGRTGVMEENRVNSKSAGFRGSLIARFREKSTDELKAILATKGECLYSGRVYEIVEVVLKERGIHN